MRKILLWSTVNELYTGTYFRGHDVNFRVREDLVVAQTQIDVRVYRGNMQLPFFRLSCQFSHSLYKVFELVYFNVLATQDNHTALGG
jgi:hypothetical protein